MEQDDKPKAEGAWKAVGGGRSGGSEGEGEGGEQIAE